MTFLFFTALFPFNVLNVQRATFHFFIITLVHHKHDNLPLSSLQKHIQPNKFFGLFKLADRPTSEVTQMLLFLSWYYCDKSGHNSCPCSKQYLALCAECSVERIEYCRSSPRLITHFPFSNFISQPEFMSINSSWAQVVYISIYILVERLLFKRVERNGFICETCCSKRRASTYHTIFTITSLNVWCTCGNWRPCQSKRFFIVPFKRVNAQVHIS